MHPIPPEPNGHRRDLEAVVAALQGRTPADRARELEELCRRDPEVAEELRALAMLHDYVACSDPIAVRIGPYEIVEKIGEGGMGVVYSARRTGDEDLLALKVMRSSGMPSEALERFRRESQLLGQLRHRGIARFVEAGEAQVRSPNGSEESVPFLALELLEGDPLLLAARSAGLGDQQKVELMLKTCDAVGHAHDHGLVHRDLKPANILVVADPEDPRGVGQPKVLDFGVARALDTDWRRNATLTGPSDLIGTVPYMSPEQITSTSEVGKGADVYSLGIVLFELLTARLPYDVRSRPLHEAARVIAEEEPQRLGSADKEWLGTGLEIILMKALEKRPGRRYEDAGALARDLRRYLSGEQVLARPPSWRRRLRRGVRRHRIAVGMTSILAAALIVSTWFGVSEADARRRAQRSAELADDRVRRANLAAAAVALQQNDFVSAERHLAAIRQSDRGWVWRHLRAAGDSSLRSVTFTELGVGGGGVLDDSPNRRLFAGSAECGVLAVEGPDKTATLFRVPAVSVEQPVERLGSTRGRAAVLDEDGQVVSSIVGDSRLEIRLVGGPVRQTVVFADLSGKVMLAASRQARHVLVLRDREAWLVDGTTGERVELKPDRSEQDHSRGHLVHPFISNEGGLVGFVEGGRIHLWRPQKSLISTCTPVDFGMRVRAICCDAAGRRLAVGTDEGTMLFEVDGGGEARLQHRFVSSRGDVRSLAFSRDGTLLAIGGADHCVSLKSVPSGRHRSTLVGHRGAIVSMRFMDGSRRLCTVGADDTVRVWSLGVGDPGIVQHEGYVYAVAFSPDGSTFYTGAWDGSIRVIDTRSGRCQATLSAGRNRRLVVDLAAHPERELIAAVVAGAGGGVVRVLDTKFGREVRVIGRREDSQARRAVFSSDGSVLVVSFSSGDVRTYRTTDWSELAACLLEPRKELPQRRRSVAVSRAGWVAVSRGARLEMLALDGLAGVASLETRGAITALSFRPDSKQIAVGYSDGVIQLFDPEQLSNDASILDAHSSAVHALVYDRLNTHLMSASHDRTVRIWDVPSEELAVVLRGHENYVHALAFDPLAEVLVSGSGDGTACIWGPYSMADRLAAGEEYDATLVRVAKRFSSVGRNLWPELLTRMNARERQVARGVLLGHSDLVR